MSCGWLTSSSRIDADWENSVEPDNSAMAIGAVDGVVSVTTPSSGGSSGRQHNAFQKNHVTQNSEINARILSLMEYPRTVTASELLDECDGDSVFCGPPSEPGESGLSELKALKSFGVEIPAHLLTGPADVMQKSGSSSPEEPKEQNNSVQPLIAPRGQIIGEFQKFVCVFAIGLDDDPEFCLVKRILGKCGCNMRRIAEECNAKVRLRGIGSGFLEGSSRMEANFPLQLNVSCEDYESYKGAVTRIAILLKDLYKHYRRYARSRGMEVPDTQFELEEVRRDDLGIDVLAEKAQRSPSERDRDRAVRKQERESKKMYSPEEEQEGKSSPGSSPTAKSFHTYANKENVMLPGGIPVPTTPTGRALAAKTGGAEAGAKVSAAAREFERQERERLREEREKREKQREMRRSVLTPVNHSANWQKQLKPTNPWRESSDDASKVSTKKVQDCKPNRKWATSPKACPPLPPTTVSLPTETTQNEVMALPPSSPRSFSSTSDAAQAKTAVAERAALAEANPPQPLSATCGATRIHTDTFKPEAATASKACWPRYGEVSILTKCSSSVPQNEHPSIFEESQGSNSLPAETYQNDFTASPPVQSDSMFASSEAAQEEQGEWQVVGRRRRKVLWVI